MTDAIMTLDIAAIKARLPEEVKIGLHKFAVRRGLTIPAIKEGE